MILRLMIDLNNFIVRKRGVCIAPGKLLLLLPHCLQRTECGRNLLHDPDNCERCGKCDMAGLLDIRDELGIQCRVVGGGREALRLVRSPDIGAVVACACEKELVDGIRAAFPKPVFAIANRRPKGPCKDTRADTPKLRSAILAMTARRC